PEVEILERATVRELLWEAGGARVVGVRVAEGRGATRELAGELVVDASGRASRLPEWLEQHGYARAPESTVGIDLKYASRLYEIPLDGSRDWQVMAVYGGPPQSRRAGVIFPIEGGRWIVTLSGCLGDHPAGEEAGFLEFARGLDRPELYEAIAAARPLSEIAVYGFPTEVRRRYEALARLPGGVIAMGDASCAFNPLYGQGVSVCALEAEALARCVAARPRTERVDTDHLPRRYYRAAAPIVARAWLLASATDLLFPEARGPRPPALGLFGWYNRQILEASSVDEVVLSRFLEVLHFLKPPTALFAPSILLRAGRWALGRRPAAPPDAD
ncbi:MAG TPA: hypothetical protein VMT50_04505, partial [Steroidobacteraceae bacterium]|nr:hypothetical protein [Steroidobacteraceae bacterium]